MKRSSLPTIFVGLALTIATGLLPFVTAGAFSDHVRAAYPDWSAAEVAKDVQVISAYLGVVAALGAVCWLITLLAVYSRKRWAFAASLTFFILGTLIALTNVSVSGRELPPNIALFGLLPCVVGVMALIQVRRSRTA